jgi:hypothetical protein
VNKVDHYKKSARSIKAKSNNWRPEYYKSKNHKQEENSKKNEKSKEHSYKQRKPPAFGRPLGLFKCLRRSRVKEKWSEA